MNRSERAISSYSFGFFSLVSEIDSSTESLIKAVSYHCSRHASIQPTYPFPQLGLSGADERSLGRLLKTVRSVSSYNNMWDFKSCLGSVSSYERTYFNFL